jgi:hypothetical protein
VTGFNRFRATDLASGRLPRRQLWHLKNAGKRCSRKGTARRTHRSSAVRGAAGGCGKSDVYRYSFASVLVKAGLKFRFHDLRHESASLLLADGGREDGSVAVGAFDCGDHAMDRGQQTAADKMLALLTRKKEAKTTGEMG